MFGPERDRDQRRKRRVRGQLAVARDQRPHVGGDDLGLRARDAGHVAVGVGDVAECEDARLAGDAKVLVDADVPAVVEPVAVEVLGARPHAERAEPDVGGELVALLAGDPDVGKRRRRGAREGAQRAAETQLDAELAELCAQLVAQLLRVRAGEDVAGHVGEGDVLAGVERLDLPASSRPAGPAPKQTHDPQSDACVRGDAALARAFVFFGKRWNAMVLGTLSGGPAGFRELARAINGISDSVLSDRLTALAEAGLIARAVDAGKPVTVAYSLTDRGRALMPALEQISLWAQEHLPEDEGRRDS